MRVNRSGWLNHVLFIFAELADKQTSQSLKADKNCLLLLQAMGIERN